MEENKNQQTEPAPEQGSAPSQTAPAVSKKKLIGAFAAMGIVIIALMTALIVTNLSGDKKVKTSSETESKAVTSKDNDSSDKNEQDGENSSEDSSESISDSSSNSESSSDNDPGDPSSKSTDSSSEGSKDSSSQSSGGDSTTNKGSNDNSGNSGSNAGSGNSGSGSNSGSNNNGNSGSSSSGNNNGSSGSNGGSTTPVSNEAYVTWGTNNTWQDGNLTMTGLDFGIVNGGSTPISGWKLELTIPGLSNKGSGWNGSYTFGKDTLTVTPAEYNSDIAAGGNIKLGGNIATSGTLNVTAAKLNGKTVKLVKGNVASDNNQQQNNNNNGGSNNNNNNNNNNNGQQRAISSEEVKKLIAAPANATKGDDWLHTSGNKIVDASGKQVWLTGLNWFGYNTGTNTFDGLWNSNLETTVKAIADHGFNLIRVPMSVELLLEWKKGVYPKANYNNADNPTLNSMNSLEIFDYFLRLCADNGIKVMPDIHSAKTDPMGHNANLWVTDGFTVNDFFTALEYIADRYKNNDTIIALDLKNEPHGKPFEGASAAIWNNSTAANNWKYVAETAANKVLAKNPNLLIMIEGTEIYSKKNGSYSSTNDSDYYFNWWGGNLRGVKDYPINLGKNQNKIVYSPHDYGPKVYEQPWFKGNFTYDSLMKDCWKDNWLYIHTSGTAPLLIGEWGGFMDGGSNEKWMGYMRQLISTYHLNHTFWCLNANSGDTGGLLTDNFKDWDTKKYNFVKQVLWQQNGKFVGLDHQKALGANGISLSQAKSL